MRQRRRMDTAGCQTSALARGSAGDVSRESVVRGVKRRGLMACTSCRFISACTEKRPA